MRNLYVRIVFFLLLFCMNSFGQNSNWYFGSDNWINFNPTPSNMPIPTVFNGSPGGVNPFSYSEGCASVSDDNGNLLFVTDGISVYENMGTSFDLVTNSLLGHNSSAQNVIIVPRPNRPLSYYIFTITGSSSGGGWLYYSEILFNSVTNHWEMGSLNTPLLTGTGMPQFSNASEGITSMVHSNCTDYWVIAHLQDGDTAGNLYSYLVTENGVVNNIPTGSLNFNEPSSEGIIRCIKVSHSDISPNLRRLAFTRSTKGVSLGTFNISNGVMLINDSISPDTSAYGLEFSPNSNFLFYTLLSTVTMPFSEIDRYDILNNTITTASTTNSSERLSSMQLAVDGNLYVVRGLGSASTIHQLNVIVNPDSTTSTVDLNTNFNLVSDASNLPQWVWKHVCCLPTLTLSSTTDDMNNNDPYLITHRERSEWIKATNLIGVGNNTFQDGVVYHAGEYVELNPGFEAVNGSQFSAYIQDCSGQYTYKNGNQEAEVETIHATSGSKEVKIYPNPTNSSFTINSSEQQFNEVSITSIEGKLVYSKKFGALHQMDLDISNFKNGMYVVSLFMEDGSVKTQKLIKN